MADLWDVMKQIETDFIDDFTARGHEFIVDEDGDVDWFVVSHGYHNGPGCVKCGDSWCMFCEKNIKECEVR